MKTFKQHILCERLSAPEAIVQNASRAAAITFAKAWKHPYYAWLVEFDYDGLEIMLPKAGYLNITIKSVAEFLVEEIYDFGGVVYPRNLLIQLYKLIIAEFYKDVYKIAKANVKGSKGFDDILAISPDFERMEDEVRKYNTTLDAPPNTNIIPIASLGLQILDSLISQEIGQNIKTNHLCAWFLRNINSYPSFMEDFEKAVQELAWFEQNKARLPENSRDINRLSPQDLFYLMNSGDYEAQEDYIALEKSGDIEILLDNDSWLFTIVKTPKAACDLGKGTRWCTTNERWARDYLKQGPLYIFRDRNTKRRYQLHLASMQFMNEADKPVQIYSVENQKVYWLPVLRSISREKWRPLNLTYDEENEIRDYFLNYQLLKNDASYYFEQFAEFLNISESSKKDVIDMIEDAIDEK